MHFCRTQGSQQSNCPNCSNRVPITKRETALPSVRQSLGSLIRALLTWKCRQIVDDGYKHSLVVYEDQQTHGIRLHAAVWDGELKQCPVWTAFGETKRNKENHDSVSWVLIRMPLVTAQSQSSTWISRRSKHRVWLRNIQLYVFCRNYRQEVQRQNKSKAFEIYFVTEQGTSPGGIYCYPDFTISVSRLMPFPSGT